MTWRTASAVIALLAIAVAAFVLARPREREASCGAGFVREGPRCRPAPGVCPAPLVVTPSGCDAARDEVVLVPATRLTIGPSDWEAEGKVAQRTLVTAAFSIDRFELTVGSGEDPARARSGVTLDEARELCRARGGRLPTEDEWVAAAAGAGASRYPWGDTGAVCRRAAWGLVEGPCGTLANGPDTVGAHPDGQTRSGIHDLAGNVAEWVEAAGPPARPPPPGVGVVRGGSYASSLATELRTWSRREVPSTRRDPTIGVRCARSGVP